jgi:hypothetical protein
MMEENRRVVATDVETGEPGECVAARETAYVYAVLDVDGRPRYVGHSLDPEQRVYSHWRHRRTPLRNRENLGFYGWLQSLACRPQYCILAVVPFADRYTAEHRWTDLLRQSAGIELLNINSGARLHPDHVARMHAAAKTPQARAKLSASLTGLQRGPWPPERKARQSAVMKRHWAEPEYRARMTAVLFGGPSARPEVA